MRRQVGRVVAAVAVLGAVLGGCGGPSQAGSAVIIGSDAIPIDVVQDQIAVALGPDKAQVLDALNQGAGGGVGPQEVAREIVTSAVLHDLITRRAAEEGLAVSDVDVDAALAARGSPEEVEQASIYVPDVLRERTRDNLLAVALGARYVDRLGVAVDVTGFETEAEAMAAADVVAAGGPGADAVFTNAPPDRVARQEAVAAENPAAASLFFFGTAAGSAIVVPPEPGNELWTLFRIDERRTDLVAQGPSAVDRFGEQDLQQIGYRMLQEASTALGVRVNPRYGVWDPIELRVVDEDRTAGTIVPPATPAAAG